MDFLLRKIFPKASDEKLRLYRGSLVVFGCMLINLTLGALYTTGNMNTYMSSYIRTKVDPTWTYAKGTWFYTATQWMYGPSMVVGGFFEYKFGSRIVVIVGCLLFTGGITITSFTIAIHAVLAVLSYGALFGTEGAAYGVCMTTGMRWFPWRKATVAGLIGSTFGLASFLWTPMQTAFLNPENLAPINVPPDPPTQKYFLDEGILNRVPYVFLLMGAIFATMQCIGCILFAPAPKPKQAEESKGTNETETTEAEARSRGEEGDNQPKDVKAAESAPDQEEPTTDAEMFKEAPLGSPAPEKVDSPSGDPSLSPKKTLRTRQFYMLFTTFFLNQQCVGYVSSMYKVFGMSFIDSDAFLAGVGSAASLGNAFGRLSWGGVSDKFGYKISMLALTALLTLLYATLPFTKYGGKFVYAIWIVAINMVVAGHFTLMPSCIYQTFGGTFASSNYGMIFAASVVSSTIQSLMLANLTPIFGENAMIWMVAGFAALNFCINLFYDKHPSPEAIRLAHNWPSYRELE